MPIEKKQIVQKVFIIIRQLQLNRTNYKYFQNLISLIDYAILISLTFWASIFNDPRQPSLGTTQPRTLNFDEFFNIISYVHTVFILVFLLACGVHIIADYSLHLDKNNHHFFFDGLIKIIVISSWTYQATFTLYFLAIAQTYSIQKILAPLSPSTFISLAASAFYVSVFRNRKIYGGYLPLIFLIRIYLNAEGSAVFTIIVSLFVWKRSQRPINTVVYVQIFLLEISQYVRMFYNIPLGSDALLNSCFIVVVIPSMYLLFGRMTILSRLNKYQMDEKLLQILKEIKQKPYQTLSLQKKMLIQSFYSIEMQKFGHFEQQLNLSDEQKLFESLIYKIQRQVDAEPKDMRKWIQKIRLNCLKKINTINTFKDIQYLNYLASSLSLHTRYSIFQFADEIMSSLNLKSTLNFEQIKQNDSIQESSEREILYFTSSLINFWQYLQKEALSEETILQKLSHLKVKEEVLQTHIQHFRKFPSLKNNLLVLQFALKCLNPQYEISSPTLTDQQPRLNFHQKKDEMSYFLSIQNQKVASISIGLCKRLGYDNLFAVGIDKSTLFPPYVSNFQNFLTDPDEKNKCTVFPLINSTGNIQPFKGKMHIRSNFEGYFSYFIHFEQFINDKYPYMIINTHQQYIDYVSKSFYSYFTDLKEENVRQVNIEELFYYKFHQVLESSLNEYCIQMRINKQERGLVKLVKIWNYQYKQNAYSFVRLEMNKNIVSNTVLNIFIQSTIEDYHQNKYEKYQNQTFFCKIPHPFQNKYNEQVLRLKDSMRWTIAEKHKRIFIIVVIILLSNIAFSKVMANINYQSSLNKLSQLQTVNKARNQLISLYQRSYQLFYMRANNVTFTFIDGPNKLQEFEQQINEVIHDLQSFRFSYHDDMNSRQINLRFNGFNVKGNTVDTNIVDITQNAKKFLKSNDPRFLVDNYQLIEAYSESYKIINILQDQTYKQNNIISYITISTLSFMAILLVIIYSDLNLTLQTSKHVIKIIMNSKKKIIQSKLKLLRHFQHFIIQNQQLYYLKDCKSSQVKLRQKNQLMSLVNHQKQLEAKSEYDMKSIIKREDSIMRKENDQDESEQVKQTKKMLFTLYNKQANFTHPIIAFFRQSYFLVIFILIAIYFFGVYSASTFFSFEKNSILDYYNDFFSTQYSILGLSARMYQSTLEQYYHISNSSSFKFNSIDLQTHFESQLPLYFDQFVTTKYDMVGSNLCSQTTNTDTNQTFDKNVCNQIQGGILTKGFSIAYGQYIMMVKKIIDSGLSITSPQLNDNDGLFKLSLIQLMQVLMIRQIESIKEIFLKVAVNFLKDSVNSLIFGNIYLEIFVLGIILLIYYHGMKRYQKRYGLIIKGFLILPKEYILNNRLLKYFTKYNVFENIAVI